MLIVLIYRSSSDLCWLWLLLLNLKPRGEFGWITMLWLSITILLNHQVLKHYDTIVYLLLLKQEEPPPPPADRYNIFVLFVHSLENRFSLQECFLRGKLTSPAIKLLIWWMDTCSVYLFIYAACIHLQVCDSYLASQRPVVKQSSVAAKLESRNVASHFNWVYSPHPSPSIPGWLD